MSLYREAGRGSARTLAVAVAVTLIVGLAVGFGIGRSSAPERTAADVVEQLRSDLQPVRSGLLLIPNEYEQAHRDEGEELSGVQGTLDRIDTQIDAAAPDLRVLDADGLASLERGVQALRGLVERKADPAEVERTVEELETALRAVPGGR